MTATDSEEPDELDLREGRDQPGSGGSADAADSGDSGDGKLEVTGVQVAASTLASVSAAGVASLFGVHGTVIGAGVASVVATIGAAVYQRGLDRTSARLQEAPVAELIRPVVTRTGARLRGEPFPEDPGFESWRESSQAASASADRPSGWRAALAGRRWGVAAGVGTVLVATLVVLSMLEVAAQRPLSGDDGGSTSIGAVFGDSSSDGSPSSEDGTTTTSAPGEDPAGSGADSSTTVPADSSGSSGSGSSSSGSSGSGSDAPDDGDSPTTGEDPSTPSTTAGGSEPTPAPGPDAPAG